MRVPNEPGFREAFGHRQQSKPRPLRFRGTYLALTDAGLTAAATRESSARALTPGDGGVAGGGDLGGARARTGWHRSACCCCLCDDICGGQHIFTVAMAWKRGGLCQSGFDPSPACLWCGGRRKGTLVYVVWVGVLLGFFCRS